MKLYIREKLHFEENKTKSANREIIQLRIEVQNEIYFDNIELVIYRENHIRYKQINIVNSINESCDKSWFCSLFSESLEGNICAGRFIMAVRRYIKSRVHVF